jgi:hypothetical protein
MKTIVTKHAKRRMRQRGVGASRLTGAARKPGTHQGKGVYRVEIDRRGITYVVVYKLVEGKKIILSTWRK